MSIPLGQLLQILSKTEATLEAKHHKKDELNNEISHLNDLMLRQQAKHQKLQQVDEFLSRNIQLSQKNSVCGFKFAQFPQQPPAMSLNSAEIKVPAINWMMNYLQEINPEQLKTLVSVKEQHRQNEVARERHKEKYIKKLQKLQEKLNGLTSQYRRDK